MFCNHCSKILNTDEIVKHWKIKDFDPTLLIPLNHQENLNSAIEAIKQKEVEIETKKQNCLALATLETCLKFLNHLQEVIGATKKDLENKKTNILKNQAISKESDQIISSLFGEGHNPRDIGFLESTIAKVKENEKKVEDLLESKEIQGNQYLETIEPNFVFQNFSSSEEFSKSVQGILSKIEKLLKASDSPTESAINSNTNSSSSIRIDEIIDVKRSKNIELPNLGGNSVKIDSNLENLVSKAEQIQITPTISASEPKPSEKGQQTKETMVVEPENTITTTITQKKPGYPENQAKKEPKKNVVRLTFPNNNNNNSNEEKDNQSQVLANLKGKQEPSTATAQATPIKASPIKPASPNLKTQPLASQDTSSTSASAFASRKRKRETLKKFQDLEEQKKSKKQKTEKNSSNSSPGAEDSSKTVSETPKNDAGMLVFPGGGEGTEEDEDLKDLKSLSVPKTMLEFAAEPGGPHGRIALKTVPQQQQQQQIPQQQSQKLSIFTSCTCWFGFLIENSTKKQILAFGDNQYGQISNSNDVYCLKHKFSVPEAFEKEQVKSIGLGSYHTIILFDNQALFGQGWFEDGRLPISEEEIGKMHETKKSHTKTLTRITFFENNGIILKKVVCGDTFSLFLSETGELYGSGSPINGRLGQNYGKSTQVKIPSKIPFNQKIVDVKCGNDFCIFLTDDKSLFSFGENKYGQCGLGILEKKTKFVDSPKKITFFNGMQIADFFVGGFHTFVQIGQKKCYSFGNNTSGQLSIINPTGPEEIYCFEPKITKIPDSVKKIAKIACGEGFSILLSEDGKIFGCGNNEYSQLCDKDEKEVPYFSQILLQFKSGERIKDIACGAHTGYFTTEDGCFGWGSSMICQVDVPNTVYDDKKLIHKISKSLKTEKLHI